MELECTWMRESNIDWFIQIPACIVLIVNLTFLIRIMFVSFSNILRISANLIKRFCSLPFFRYHFNFIAQFFFYHLEVLITKLRSANTVETRQYRKASKALLVLIPLLGITYLIVIAGPNEGLESHIFAILRALLLSIQGFSVALFYCFLNSEVRLALRHRFNRWRDSRNLSSGNSIRSRRYTMSKDYSPRSRTESIRWVEKFDGSWLD